MRVGLVGSEMCIRDRCWCRPCPAGVGVVHVRLVFPVCIGVVPVRLVWWCRPCPAGVGVSCLCWCRPCPAGVGVSCLCWCRPCPAGRTLTQGSETSVGQLLAASDFLCLRFFGFLADDLFVLLGLLFRLVTSLFPWLIHSCDISISWLICPCVAFFVF